MSPIEKLQELVAKATLAPWGTDKDGVTCPPDRPDQAPFYVEFEGDKDVDSLLVAALRNLAPEFLGLWQACRVWSCNIPTIEGDNALHDAIAALNAKADEVLK